MIDLLPVLAGFLICLVLSELVLGKIKVQTGLARVVAVHFVCWCATLAYMLLTGKAGVVAVTGFWAGGFLSWFGVRSHAESSILLRMLYLLRQGPMTADQWLELYHSHYGPDLRMEELFRGGLLERTADGVVVTMKARRILKAVEWLR